MKLVCYRARTNVARSAKAIPTIVCYHSFCQSKMAIKVTIFMLPNISDINCTGITGTTGLDVSVRKFFSCITTEQKQTNRKYMDKKPA